MLEANKSKLNMKIVFPLFRGSLKIIIRTTPSYDTQVNFMYDIFLL